MFGGQISENSFNIFKWKSHSRLSLRTGLLKEVPHEIELSDYHIAPSPSSESPSGLLDGEASHVELIDDLDLFFERIYTYYCEKGLWCIIYKWIFELLTLLFIICFSAFILLYVDWNGLRNAKCGMYAVKSRIKSCNLSEEALHKHPLTSFTLSKAIVVGYLSTISFYWIFCFLKFLTQLKETLKIRRFYYSSLDVRDNDIKTKPWPEILEKIVKVQSLQQLCVVKDLSIHDVVMRLMRKENYLIGMVNKGVLSFSISGWVPGAGPTVRVGPNGIQHRLLLTKTLEWSLNWCILQSMFDRNSRLRREFISDPKTLRKRLVIVGLAMLLLSPFIVIFMLVYLFLRHAEQLYKHPSTFAHRRWSNLSKWMFREFNEIFGRNLFWYTVVFGAITAISRATIVDELLVLDPLGAMSRVVQHTHYMPKRWRGKENTDTVRQEFEALFQYTGMVLLEEMASIFITPYLLLFVIPKRVDDILQFIVNFTVDVEGVGHVCCFSPFDFENHGNKKYGSPFNSPSIQRSSQGKMEKSILSFQISYPAWEPNAHGKQFLASLKAFRDQKLQGERTKIGHLASRMQQQQSPNFRGFGQRNSFFSTEMPFRYMETNPIWFVDGEQKNSPYFLDMYYTSQNPDESGYLRRISSHTCAGNEGNDKDFWRACYSTQNEEKHGDNGRYLVEDRLQSHLEASTSGHHRAEGHWWDRSQPRHRVQSHLEASSSASFFQESVLQHDYSSNTEHHRNESPWWDRSQKQGTEQHTSFLHPPNFFRSNAPHDHHYDNSSNGSIHDQEHSEWRSRRYLSQTFFMDDLDAGELCLPFDYIYSSRPFERSSSENADPTYLV